MTWIDVLVEHAQDQIYIVPYRIPIVIFSAVAIYFVFLLLMKIFGSRVLASMSASDAVVIIMFGAVAGRVILGHPPTLATGIIGLATLIAMQALFGIFRTNTGIDHILASDLILFYFDVLLFQPCFLITYILYNHQRTTPLT